MARRALVSVTDKSNLEDLKPLFDIGWDFVSTGGSLVALDKVGIKAIPVEEVTGFPEMLDGRLKTLHPKIFGGILADRSKPEHMAAIAEHGIEPIDLVAANLYDFYRAQEVEQIDIGGPSLIRAAAKNYRSVAVIVDPSLYQPIVAEILAFGAVTQLTRRKLAAMTFRETGIYDTTICKWFEATER